LGRPKTWTQKKTAPIANRGCFAKDTERRLPDSIIAPGGAMSSSYRREISRVELQRVRESNPSGWLSHSTAWQATSSTHWQYPPDVVCLKGLSPPNWKICDGENKFVSGSNSGERATDADHRSHRRIEVRYPPFRKGRERMGHPAERTASRGEGNEGKTVSAMEPPYSSQKRA
jgi:hypothetical protein